MMDFSLRLVFSLQRCARSLVLIFALQCSPFGSHATAQTPTKALTELRTFPIDSTGIYLNYPTRIRVHDDQVFVLDNNENQLHVFSRKGEPELAIGGQGQGPGEFHFPGDFWVEGDTIWVVDSGNNRMQTFTRTGKLLDTSAWQTLGRVLIMSGNEVVFLQTRRGFHNGNEKEDLLNRYDRSGQKLGSFGAWIDLSPGLPLVVSNSFLSLHEESLYVLSAFYPVLREYTLEGSLVRTINFDPLTESYEQRVTQNYDWDVLTDQNTNMVQTRFLFRAIRVVDSGIYVGLYDENLRIDHYDLNGRLLGSYTAAASTEEGLYLHDFEITKNRKGELELYALIRDVFPRIAVYPLTPFRP